MPPTSRRWLLASAHPLTRDHDVALLDLDGVVYVGPDVVPGAAEALGRARADGLRLAFVTNNAARPPAVVADHLTELGIDAKAREIVTSAQAAARYLADRLPGGARVLVVGTTGLVEALRERGLEPVSTSDGRVDAVVQGYSPQLSWAQLAEGAVAINRGVLWVATNGDPTVPSPRGPLPGNGSLVAALCHATRRVPITTGKPDPTMHREMVLRSQAEHPIVVGDRLDTDIEGASAVGCPSLLVFSGVTTVPDLLQAPPALRPTYLAADVSGLLTAHPETTVDDGSARCGAWTVRAQPDNLVLSRHGSGSEPDSAVGAGSGSGGWDSDLLDAVRALCAVSWSRADAAEHRSGHARASGAESGDRGASADPVVVAADGDEAADEALRRLGLAT